MTATKRTVPLLHADRAFRAEASTGAAVFRLNELSTIEKCIQKGDEMLYRRKEERHAGRS